MDDIREDGAAPVEESHTETAPEGVQGAAENLEKPEGAEEQTENQLNAPTAEEQEQEAREVETAWYRITGLVDVFDEQGNIVSQFPIGSKQEMPVSYGDKCVEEGRAERITDDEVE